MIEYENVSSDEEEIDEEHEKHMCAEHIKKTYTLEQFLECPKTREMIENEHYQNFLDSYGKEASHFYETERRLYRGYLSSLFKFDTDGCIGGRLSSIIYNNIEKKYDLEIFYEDTSLVVPLKIYLKNKGAKKRERMKVPKNATKVFNWTTKTHE